MASIVARTLMAIGTLTALAAAPAHASNVQWSVGIHAPIAPGVAVGTVFGTGPVVAPVVVPPVYVPAPVYAAPVYGPPVYGPPVYAPIYAPRVVYGPPVWVGGRWVRHPGHYAHAVPAAWHKHGHRGPPVYRPGREIRY